MVLKTKTNWLLAALLVSGVSLSACGDEVTDGKNDPTEDDIQECVDNPTDDTCGDVVDYCEKNQSVGACQDVLDFCNEHKEDPACGATSDTIDCEETPDDPSCNKDGDFYCEKTPDDPSCNKDGEVDCEKTPDDPSCTVTPAACVDEDGNLTQEAKDEIIGALNIQNTPYADIPEVSVTVKTEVDNPDYDPEVDDESAATIKANNYRVLSFELPVVMSLPDPNDLKSKLYLDIDTNTFLNISDEEALTNADWDIAFDTDYFNYAYMNSGYSGGYFGAWPAGLRIAEVTDVQNQAELLAVPGPDLAGDMILEQWYDKDSCSVKKTNWLNPGNSPDFAPGKILPKTVVGAWYHYDFSNNHASDPTPVAYAVYDSNMNHHVYTFQFLSFASGIVKLGVHDQFQQNACKEANAIQELMSVSDSVPADVPEVTTEAQADVPLLDENGNPIVNDGEASVAPYKLLQFTLPTERPEDSSKLYLNIETGEFQAISDEEALGFAKDQDGNVLRNDNWHIAIDVNDDNFVSLRSGQAGGYLHLDKYVTGWAPRGAMGYSKDNVADEQDFIAWNAGADAQFFSTEDLIDHNDAACTIDGEFISGTALFDADADAALGIYMSSPCHKVWQIKVLNQEEGADGLDVTMGVILSNPGVPSPSCN